MASSHLGFSQYDASKVMGLAAYGNPATSRSQLHQVLRVDKEDYALAQSFLDLIRAFKHFSLDGRPCSIRHATWTPSILPRHADIAAVLQEATVMALVRHLERKVPFESLCLASDVALNCVTNELVRRSGDFADAFIPSAPHDAGAAIGAAFVVIALSPRPGRREAAQCRISVPRSTGAKFWRRSSRPASPPSGASRQREAADMIADGKIVAWFQGRMEFKAARPRQPFAARRPAPAGHAQHPPIRRSSTARTFALSRRASWPSTPTNGSSWAAHATSHEFMLFACGVKPGRRDRVPAVVHQDGSARVQLVSP